MLLVLALAAAPALAQSTTRHVSGESEVTPRIPRPEVEIVVSRQSLPVPPDLRLEQSFLPKVREALALKPF